MRRTTILSISISLAFMLFATTGLSFAADKALIEAAKQVERLMADRILRDQLTNYA